MKSSIYNIFYPFEKDENQVLAYNVRTNALALIDKETWNKLTNSIDKIEKLIADNVLLELEKGGFILEEDIDELDLLKYSMLSNRYNTQYFALTIAPTLNCNFACTYCYEKNNKSNSVMTPEVQEKVIDLIKNHISTIKALSITWYGGEPLLALDIIENISKKVIDLCEKNSVMYSAKIITNGYKLNKNVAQKLMELKISTVQITLDGSRDIHNERRPLVGGQGSFDAILKNIVESVDILKDVAVRINTDKENAPRVEELLKVFEEYGLKNKIHPYLGFVEHTNDCYFKGHCLTKEGFSKVQYNFIKKLEKMGFAKDITFKYPSLIGNFCGADFINSFVIDSYGDVYKCWSDIGMKKYRIGNLIDKNNVKYSLATHMKYMLYDPTCDDKCRNCICLPICMGGCPKCRQEVEEERCTEYKYGLETYLKEIACTITDNN